MTLASPDKTGAARMAQVFCRALGEAGHRVRLIHGPPPASNILDDMRAVGVDPKLEARLTFPLSPAVPRRVAELARQWGAGAVIGVNQRDRAVALQAARRLGVPGLLMMQSLHMFWGGWPIAALKRAYYTRTLQRDLRLAVCCSLAVQTELVQEFGIQPERTAVLPNGVDLERYVPLPPESQARVRADLGLAADELMLLNVGRIDRQKGQDLLLEALSQVHSERPWRLVIVGGVTSGAGQDRSEQFRQGLLRSVERLGLGPRVLFAGWREDIPALLASADIYVHPSRYEGWPLAVVEAMASGLPVVATDCVGRPGGFEDGKHGFIVRTEDVQALARALTRTCALTDPERQSWGAAGRELARAQYDVRALGQRFVQLVEGVL
ncbi:MAG: glycosyl transferase family 1 [Candidatus Xenobia bacterium]